MSSAAVIQNTLLGNALQSVEAHRRCALPGAGNQYSLGAGLWGTEMSSSLTAIRDCHHLRTSNSDVDHVHTDSLWVPPDSYNSVLCTRGPDCARPERQPCRKKSRRPLSANCRGRLSLSAHHLPWRLPQASKARCGRRGAAPHALRLPAPPTPRAPGYSRGGGWSPCGGAGAGGERREAAGGRGAAASP